MGNKFTTSVNILRDDNRDVHYIPTANVQQIVSQLCNDFKKGIRSFNLIGTYGTGKSSFLLALEQSLQGKKRFFEPNFLSDANVAIIKFIGAYESIIESFKQHFDVNSRRNISENIFSEIFNEYRKLGENGLLFLFIDEFGKYLEYAAQNNPELELYFIQQLAEFCNDPKRNIVLLTTVHQNFESYSFGLKNSQKQEWIKVKGRFKEITFNEPVEQLLFLAAEHISNELPQTGNKSKILKAFDIGYSTKAYDFNKSYAKEIAQKIFPLEILSAGTLTLSLQRYGQNERSLFSFLESTDHTSLSKSKRGEFYDLTNVYDYLNRNFYSFLTSKYNPDFLAWTAIKNAIDEIERTFHEYTDDIIRVVKVIGLLNLFSANGSILNDAFLIQYLDVCVGIKNAHVLIEKLKAKKIVFYRSYSHRYVIWAGTDLDIENALNEAGKNINEVTDVITLLNRYYQLPPIMAKQYTYLRGTPRFFEFKISSEPISISPIGEIDGYINLIFSDTLLQEQIEDFSSNEEEAIIYVFYKNSKGIKDLLFEIEKTKKVIDENRDDKVAKKELENILVHQTNLLNHYILANLYNNNHEITWVWHGKKIEVNSRRDFNVLLSQVAMQVYSDAPIFKNELVNKHKLSGQIHFAKRNYFKALVNNWNMPEIGFEQSKFPPEKTIYLSLLKENGLSPYQENGAINQVNNTSSFYNLWEASESFIISARAQKKSIIELSNLLSKKPFKLKQGLIDFWIPSFLFLKRNDFALFNEEGYIPVISEDILELIAKDPEDYRIKAFDVEGVKVDIFNSYRVFLNQPTELRFDNKVFIETIKPFLTFYRNLPLYARQTSRLEDDTINIREAISKSEDPEKTFFEDFPTAFNTSVELLKEDKEKLLEYTKRLQDSIRELRTCFDELVLRFELFIANEVIYEQTSFEIIKGKLQARYEKLKKHLLLSNQRVFVQRLNSQLDDKRAWLNSMAQAVIGKPFESFNDDDEFVLYDKFKSMIIELDGLTNISLDDVDEEKEDIIGIKIDSFFSELDPHIVRIPKKKQAEISILKEALKGILSKDKTMNIAALSNLLKDLLQ